MSTITVDNTGTALAYLDSGPPVAAVGAYVTLFVIHGTVFGFHIYDKLLALAQVFGIRLVAISRRGYRGSTPFPPGQVEGLANASDEQKEAFLLARGTEVAAFIDRFIQEFNLPPISVDGATGGVALLGWSLGCSVALSVVSHMDKYPESVRTRLRDYTRALILHEPPQVALGLPQAPKSWTPQFDTSITPEQALQVGVQWLTAYFQHGDLSTRSPDIIEYVVPATFRPPSIFTMSDTQIAQILSVDQNGPDTIWFLSCAAQLHASYKKACFDKDIRAQLPKMTVTTLIGNSSLSFGINAIWQMEDDDAAAGGGLVDFVWIPRSNHFMHWDDPDLE